MTRINHNITAMITSGSLNHNNMNLQKSLERLSTGLRINKASDDVAGLSVSEKIRTQVRGTAAASNGLNSPSAGAAAIAFMKDLRSIRFLLTP